MIVQAKYPLWKILFVCLDQYMGGGYCFRGMEFPIPPGGYTMYKTTICLLSLFIVSTALARSVSIEPTTNPLWSAAQVIGPPDCPGQGDFGQAWATLEADAGTEWLILEYERAVPISEVRIHENYNPGAIVALSAMTDDGEVTLWAGQAPADQSTHVFVIKPDRQVKTQRIKLHLDTSKVPGWNEIDAVELIGINGSRQWVSKASASSSYASEDVIINPLAALQGQQVIITLSGGIIVEGEFIADRSEFIEIKQGERRRLVTRAHILVIEH